MEATIYATPRTVVFRFAREEEAFWSGYGEGYYFRNAGKHVHFTWNMQVLSFLPKEEGDLPKSKIGEWRFSEEGVRYQPVPSRNSNEFIYRIDGGQFGFLQQRDFEKAKLETAAAFEVRVPADKCPMVL